MDALRFQVICDYVEFDAETSTTLVGLLPSVQPHLPALVDDFYDAINRDPVARQVITGGEDQVERLKHTLLAWLQSLFSGPHDEQYLESRRKIGRAHVRINLPQEYMLTAVNRIREGLVRVVFRSIAEHDTVTAVSAINKALDLELALMLDTYREDWLSRTDAAARLAAIGQIAASIGHELRNPLGVMESSIYLITQRLRNTGIEDDVLDKHLTRIHYQIGQSASIVSTLLDMVRDAPLERTRFILKDFIEGCTSHVYHPPELMFSIEVDPSLVVYADHEQLTRVMHNLLRNAVEAIGGPGIIQIGARSSRGGVELWLEDTGPGIPEANRARIFDPLFTTRSKGTGLGLPLCRRILDRHGGALTLDSTSAKGSRFKLWLPSAAAAPHS